jgi:hypothetical protein
VRTIGRHWPKSWRGSYAAHCDYCGVRWPRFKMVRDGAGLLACPDDQKGRDTVTLDRENAAGAREASNHGSDGDGGSYFRVDIHEVPIQRLTREDI